MLTGEIGYLVIKPFGVPSKKQNTCKCSLVFLLDFFVTLILKQFFTTD